MIDQSWTGIWGPIRSSQEKSQGEPQRGGVSSASVNHGQVPGVRFSINLSHRGFKITALVEIKTRTKNI